MALGDFNTVWTGTGWGTLDEALYGSPEVADPVGYYEPEPLYTYIAPMAEPVYVAPYVPPMQPVSPPVSLLAVSDVATTTMDYYGNVVDSRGNLIDTRYYESQAWKDQVAANNAVQAATEVVRNLGAAIERGEVVDPAVWNVAVAAEGRAVQSYERVGGEYHDTSINTGYAKTAVSEGNTARAAVGLPPLPPHQAPTPTNVMTPGVPGGPIDTPPPPAPVPSWEMEEGGALGGIIQVLTLGSLAAQVVRWLR